MSYARKPLRIDVIWRRLDELTRFTWDPGGVARLGVLDWACRWSLLAWLRPLEAIVRRLLLLEALALPAPEVR